MHGAWLLLVTNLPGARATLRMRLWRALKASGAATLRDGAYLLPNSGDAERVLSERALEVREGGGTAHVIGFDARSAAEQQAYVGLFDRTPEYAALQEKLDSARQSLGKSNEARARRNLAMLRREASQLASIDHFAGKAREQLEQGIADLEMAIRSRFAPDEPRGVAREIAKCDPAKYRGRTWATRRKLWIDRVSSAWLIRRFIDPKARFVWIQRPADCPKRAVGFDFDGAEFTHVGSRVTFETLLASFGLDADPALVRIGGMVHFLDVGGIPVAEAGGFAAVVAGARISSADDDALLGTIGPVLDSLYAAFAHPERS